MLKNRVYFTLMLFDIEFLVSFFVVGCVDLALHNIGHHGDSHDRPVAMSSVRHSFEANGQHK